jgi:hypothetical protein
MTDVAAGTGSAFDVTVSHEPAAPTIVDRLDEIAAAERKVAKLEDHLAAAYKRLAELESG